MNIQNILDARFLTFKEAIAEYGHPILRICIASRPPLRPLPCSFDQDWVVPRAQPLKRSTIKLVLQQFCDGRGNYWWQYTNDGEV